MEDLCCEGLPMEKSVRAISNAGACAPSLEQFDFTTYDSENCIGGNLYKLKTTTTDDAWNSNIREAEIGRSTESIDCITDTNECGQPPDSVDSHMQHVVQDKPLMFNAIVQDDSSVCEIDIDYPAPINQLTDEMLTRIFTMLPFKERFQAGIVSVKWAAVSRAPWTDITSLSLNDIPEVMTSAVLKRCPCVREMDAYDRTIILVDGENQQIISHLRRMRLRKVRFAMQRFVYNDEQTLARFCSLMNTFFKQFPAISELVWQNVVAVELRSASDQTRPMTPPEKEHHDEDQKIELMMPQAMALSLRRLLLLDVHEASLADGHIPIYLNLQHCGGLECLHVQREYDSYSCSKSEIFSEVRTALEMNALPSLRELSLIQTDLDLDDVAEIVCSKLLHLEVLVFAACHAATHSGIKRMLIHVHPNLHILVIAGRDNHIIACAIERRLEELQGHPVGPPVFPAVIPARACSLLAPEHPPLKLFIGGQIVKQMRFTLAPGGNVSFFQIDCPMAEFLDKPEIMTIFEGVWIAKTIRDVVKYGVHEWGYPKGEHVFHCSDALLFC